MFVNKVEPSSLFIETGSENQVNPSFSLMKLEVKKNEIKVSLGKQESIISFESVFKSKMYCGCLPRIRGFHSSQERENLVIHTAQKNIKIVDTQIPIPGTEKTLKFYVEKKKEIVNGSSLLFYNYWVKNVRLLHSALQFENSASLEETKLTINGVSFPILVAKGSYNQRSMVAIGSTYIPYDQRMLYSVSLVDYNDYDQECAELNQFVHSINEFVRVNKQMNKYLNCLALPCLVKHRPLTSTLFKQPSVAVYVKMLNGHLGHLDFLIQQKDVKFQIEHIKHAYEGLLLLWAAGFSHCDIKPKNIVKNNEGFLLIDFAFATKLKREKLVLKGSVPYFSPQKYLVKDIEYHAIGNDMYAFCLSFILAYLDMDRRSINYVEFYDKFKNIFAKKSLYQRIDRVYSDDDLMKILLKKMFNFCLALSSDFSSHSTHDYTAITFFLTDLAETLGIRDRALINKAALNSTCLELEKNQAIDDSDVTIENRLASEIQDYVLMHPELKPYSHCLSFNHSARLENLNRIHENGKVHYEIDYVRPAYEGLLLLWGAGFFHGDIHPEKIVKNERGFSLIDFRYAGKIESQRLVTRGTPAYLSPQKHVAGQYQYCPLENDLYGFCLSFIIPYLKSFPDFVPSQHLLHLFGNSVIKDTFYNEIEACYPENGPMRKTLKKMFQFCFAVSQATQSDAVRIRPIPFYVSDIAFAMGIQDSRLVEKSIAHSMCSEEKKRDLIEDFKHNVREEITLSAFFWR